MNRGLLVAGFLARSRLQKQAAGMGDAAAQTAMGAGELIRGLGKGVTTAGKAWGEGASAAGKSVTKQMQRSGMRHSRSAGALTSGALKAAPYLGAGYLGYKAFEPEVRSAKQRLGQAMRGRVALFKARRRAAMPYYHEGRFQ